MRSGGAADSAFPNMCTHIQVLLSGSAVVGVLHQELEQFLVQYDDSRQLR